MTCAAVCRPTDHGGLLPATADRSAPATDRAAGGGVGLSLVCDIAVCCKSAKFKLTFTPNLSLVPDLGATFQLPRLIGRQRAIGLSLLGDTISGEEAGRIGLVYKCVPDEQLMSTVHDIAMRLADGPTAAQYAVRRIMDKSLNNTYAEQLVMLQHLKMLMLNLIAYVDYS